MNPVAEVKTNPNPAPELAIVNGGNAMANSKDVVVTRVSTGGGLPFMKSTDSANWILVTGSSSGIGRATTFTLAENGYRVLAGVRKQEDVESLLAEAGTRRVVGAVDHSGCDGCRSDRSGSGNCQGQNRGWRQTPRSR